MLLEIKDVATPDDLMSKTLTQMCLRQPPHLMLSASLWWETGDRQVLAERHEVAWWLQVDGAGNVVDFKSACFRLTKWHQDGGKWVVALDGEPDDLWTENREEDPRVLDSFDETKRAWLMDVATVGLVVALGYQYPWPTLPPKVDGSNDDQ